MENCFKITCFYLLINYFHVGFPLLCYEANFELTVNSKLVECQDFVKLCYIVMTRSLTLAGCSTNPDVEIMRHRGHFYICSDDRCNSASKLVTLNRNESMADDTAAAKYIKTTIQTESYEDLFLSTKNQRYRKIERRSVRKRIPLRSKVDFVEYVLENSARISKAHLSVTSTITVTMILQRDKCSST